MSAACRIFSAAFAATGAPGAARHGLAPRLGVVHAGPEQPRERGADQQVVEAAGGVLVHPVPLVAVEHRAPGPPRAPGPRASRSRSGACCRGRGSSSSARRRSSRSARKANSSSSSSASSRRLHLRQQLVVPVRLGREVAEVLVDPVRGQRALDVLVPPVGACAPPRATPPRCSSRRGRRGRRRSSSSTRWRGASGSPGRSSSRGTGACTPRSRARRSPGGSDGSRRVSMNARVAGRHLVGVHLVAEHQQHVGPVARAARSRMRRASVRSASISRPRSSSSFVSEYGGSCGAATRQEPNSDPQRRSPSGRCGTRSAGQPSARGQTRSPSRCTSYSCQVPGSRSPQQTSA